MYAIRSYYGVRRRGSAPVVTAERTAGGRLALGPRRGRYLDVGEQLAAGRMDPGPGPVEALETFDLVYRSLCRITSYNVCYTKLLRKVSTTGTGMMRLPLPA